VVLKFARMKLADVGLASVMEWIDEQRAAGALSEASIRHNMNLLSRFFSWAIAREKASINPVRQIPMGSRPTQTVKSDTPWLDDDAIVRKLIGDLEEPINFMFYLCNRSGLRTGEAAGLRMSDMTFVDEGLIRVRFSYEGPLKEDKKGAGKVKWVPAPEDCAEFLGAWLAQRKAQGAGPEAHVFPCARREPSPVARRLARRGERRRRPFVAGGHEAVLRSLRAAHVLAEAARRAWPGLEATGCARRSDEARLARQLYEDSQPRRARVQVDDDAEDARRHRVHERSGRGHVCVPTSEARGFCIPATSAASSGRLRTAPSTPMWSEQLP